MSGPFPAFGGMGGSMGSVGSGGGGGGGAGVGLGGAASGSAANPAAGPFIQNGHCLFALLAACLGALLGNRLFGAVVDKSEPITAGHRLSQRQDRESGGS